MKELVNSMQLNLSQQDLLLQDIDDNKKDFKQEAVTSMIKEKRAQRITIIRFENRDSFRLIKPLM